MRHSGNIQQDQGEDTLNIHGGMQKQHVNMQWLEVDVEEGNMGSM